MPEIIKSELRIGEHTVKRNTNPDNTEQLDEYQKYYDATSSDRDREAENLGFYYGLDDKQWPSHINLEEERRAGRHIGTYNLTARKVDGIAGSLARNPFDVKYVGDAPEMDPLTQALQQAYFSDKELMDWMSEDLQGLRYGLIYRSWLTMGVKTDMPASPLGNISITCDLPLSNIPDPNWKTTSAKDLMTLYHRGYMTPQRMMQVYDTKSDEIKHEMEMDRIFGTDFDENQSVDWNKDYRNPASGSQKEVIEKHWLDIQFVEREIDPVTGVIFWEWLDDDVKIELANRYNIPPERIRKRKVETKIYRIRTISPDYPNLVLEDGEHILQVGRILKFPWTATWINGKCMGIIDFLKDAQEEVNYRIATITQGAQGAVMAGIQVDEAIFGNDDGQFQNFKKDYGSSRQVAKVKSGMSRMFPDGIKPLPRVQIAQELFQIEKNMIDLMDLLVPQPAAGEARTERSGESGIHFAQKLEVMKTMQSPMMMSRRQLWNDIGEAYMLAAAQLYSKGMRRFRSADGQGDVVINEEVVGPGGRPYVNNDFSKLSTMRHRVQISESPSGVNIRLMNRELGTGLLQMWPQDMPNSKIALVELIARSTDMSEEEKEHAKTGIEKDKALIESRTMAELAQNQAVVKQLSGPPQQPQQMGGNPQQGPPIQPGQSGMPPQVPEALATPSAPEPAIANPPQGAGGA